VVKKRQGNLGFNIKCNARRKGNPRIFIVLSEMEFF
jgi:hypothetical protein